MQRSTAAACVDSRFGMSAQPPAWPMRDCRAFALRLVKGSFGPKLIAGALDAPAHLIGIDLAADRDRPEPPVASRIAEALLLVYRAEQNELAPPAP